MRFCCSIVVLFALSGVFAPVVGAEQTGIGTTAAVNVETKGTPPSMATRTLYIGANVFSRERIETSKTGQAQLLFLDESALTIASNSDVVLDRFIYDPTTSAGEIVLSVGAGVFRFVGGRISKTTPVIIKTPSATLGIRGGIIIIKVEPGTGATRAIFVFGHEMTVTNQSGVTMRVTRPGFFVDVVSLDVPPSPPVKVTGAVVANYLTELEGRTGQTAGAGDPPSDNDVASSGIDGLGSSNDPGPAGGDTTFEAPPLAIGIEDIVDITDGLKQKTQLPK